MTCKHENIVSLNHLLPIHTSITCNYEKKLGKKLNRPHFYETSQKFVFYAYFIVGFQYQVRFVVRITRKKGARNFHPKL
jgi:hypothetical protein